MTWVSLLEPHIGKTIGLNYDRDNPTAVRAAILAAVDPDLMTLDEPDSQRRHHIPLSAVLSVMEQPDEPPPPRGLGRLLAPPSANPAMSVAQRFPLTVIVDRLVVYGGGGVIGVALPLPGQ